MFQSGRQLPTHITYWLHGLIAGAIQGSINVGFMAVLAFALGTSVAWLVSLFPVLGMLSSNMVATGTTLLIYAILADFGACLAGGALGGVVFGAFTQGMGVKDARPIHTKVKELNSTWHSTLPPGLRAVIAPTIFLVAGGSLVYAIVAGIGVALGLGTAAPIVAYLVPFGIYILNGMFASNHARHTWSLKP